MHGGEDGSCTRDGEEPAAVHHVLLEPPPELVVEHRHARGAVLVLQHHGPTAGAVVRPAHANKAQASQYQGEVCEQKLQHGSTTTQYQGEAFEQPAALPYLPSRSSPALAPPLPLPPAAPTTPPPSPSGEPSSPLRERRDEEEDGQKPSEGRVVRLESRSAWMMRWMASDRRSSRPFSNNT